MKPKPSKRQGFITRKDGAYVSNEHTQSSRGERRERKRAGKPTDEEIVVDKIKRYFM